MWIKFRKVERLICLTLSKIVIQRQITNFYYGSLGRYFLKGVYRNILHVCKCLRTDLKGVRLEHAGEKKGSKKNKICVYLLNNSTLKASGNRIVN